LQTARSAVGRRKSVKKERRNGVNQAGGLVAELGHVVVEKRFVGRQEGFGRGGGVWQSNSESFAGVAKPPADDMISKVLKTCHEMKDLIAGKSVELCDKPEELFHGSLSSKI